MLPTTPFSIIEPNTQKAIQELLPLSGQFKYDLRFDANGPYVVATENGGYTARELWMWARGTKYIELSAKNKIQILHAIKAALPNNDFVACIYSEPGLYKVGTFEEEPSQAVWDEFRRASEWLIVLKLNGPDAPSGDSCISLEIEALEDANDDWERRFHALEADMQGTMRVNQELRSKLENIQAILG